MGKVVLTTSRSMKLLREQGWSHVGSVEKWIPGANVRRDLFGFIDLIALEPRIPAVVAIQCYTESARAAHLRKLAELDAKTGAVSAWLASNGRLVLHEWRKRVTVPRARGRKKDTKARQSWECVPMAVTLDDKSLFDVIVWFPDGIRELESFTVDGAEVPR